MTMRSYQETPIVHPADEVGEHLLGDFKVSDDTIFERTNRDDMARRAPEHLLGFFADCFDLVGVLVDGDDRRLAHNDPFVAHEHESVRCAEINGDVVGKR